MKFFLIMTVFLIPAILCQDIESEVSDSPGEENLENLETVKETEPLEVALPEATEGPEAVAIETTPLLNQTAPEKIQSNGTFSSQEKDSEVDSKNLIGNSASSKCEKIMLILGSISVLLFV